MRALSRAPNTPGYPLTSGTAELRDAIVSDLTRRWGATELDPAATLPVIGTKELVAWLPTLLGLGRDDLVVYPTMAYPTYLVGAKIAGCRAVACDDLDQLGNARPALIWINSPSNPTGEILDPEALKHRVSWAREHGALVASDECYGEFGWDAEPISVLHPEINEGHHDGLLALHSLSKRSNVAGYRAGFVAGDRDVVADLLLIRKHAGMLVPRPVQEVMIDLLGDDDHVAQQRGDISSAAPCCDRRWKRLASGSSTRRERSTSGPPATRAAMRRWISSRTWASWSRRVTSTDLPPGCTYASP
jgi:succinyldiaminopimelate transaminase